MITAFVLVRCEPRLVPETAEALAALEGVHEVYSVTGDHDLIVVVKVRDHDDLALVISDRLRKLEGVRETRTHLAFRAYSKADLAAAYDIGG